MAYTVTGTGKIARETLIAYLKTGETGSNPAAPVWSPLGKGVSDSSIEMDWQEETVKDILGNTETSYKKPIMTQEFEAPLNAGEASATKIWELAVRDQDAQSLTAQTVLIVHAYTTDGETNPKFFAETYDGCAVSVTTLGGEGGGDLIMGSKCVLGGNRVTGGATITNKVPTFTPDA